MIYGVLLILVAAALAGLLWRLNSFERSEFRQAKR